jgi:Uma2 family endonuclease
MSPAIAYEMLHHYTYDDYLTWEGEWELIDGVAYAMSPAPYPKHQKIVARVWKELDAHLECSDPSCEVYISPIDWKVSDDTVVQPDVALFCEETDKQYFSNTPPIVVEVLSKATALKDVTSKFDLYEREGVRYYVIIDPENEISDIFQSVDGHYVLQKKATREESYTFELEACNTMIDFSKVFG